jgi:hypothetical protein
MLFEYAKNSRRQAIRAFFHFISFMTRLMESDADLSPAKVLAENSNVVRIMCIHKSKGWSSRMRHPLLRQGDQQADMPRPFLSTASWGWGRGFSIRADARVSTIAKAALGVRISGELLAEEMRFCTWP